MTYIIPDISNYQVTGTVESSFQDLTTSFSEVIGSKINYNPESGLSKVCYEFTTSYAWVSTASNKVDFKLLSGSSVGSLSDVGDGYFCTIGRGANARSENIINIKFILDSWTGNKILALHARDNDSTDPANLHGFQRSDRSETDIYFSPSVSCFSYKG